MNLSFPLSVARCFICNHFKAMNSSQTNLSAFLVDETWVCYGLTEENGTWLNTSTMTRDCSFRFYRMNGIVVIIFSILIFPANFMAIYKFYQSKISRTFFILTTYLCIGNVAMGINGIYTGIFNLTDRHPGGYWGCVYSCLSYLVFISTTLLTQVILSYERKRAITSTTFLTANYRIYLFLLIALLYSIILGCIYYIKPMGIVNFTRVRYDKNSTETFDVCTSNDFAFSGLGDLIYSLVIIAFPLVIIIYNYW